MKKPLTTGNKMAKLNLLLQGNFIDQVLILSRTMVFWFGEARKPEVGGPPEASSIEAELRLC